MLSVSERKTCLLSYSLLHIYLFVEVYTLFQTLSVTLSFTCLSKVTHCSKLSLLHIYLFVEGYTLFQTLSVTHLPVCRSLHTVPNALCYTFTCLSKFTHCSKHSLLHIYLFVEVYTLFQTLFATHSLVCRSLHTVPNALCYTFTCLSKFIQCSKHSLLATNLLVCRRLQNVLNTLCYLYIYLFVEDYTMFETLSAIYKFTCLSSFTKCLKHSLLSTHLLVCRSLQNVPNSKIDLNRNKECLPYFTNTIFTGFSCITFFC